VLPTRRPIELIVNISERLLNAFTEVRKPGKRFFAMREHRQVRGKVQTVCLRGLAIGTGVGLRRWVKWDSITPVL